MEIPVALYPVNLLSEAQNHRCAYCQLVMLTSHDLTAITDHPPARVTREHVEPRSTGGSDDWENLVAVCQLCNSLRSVANQQWYIDFLGRLFTLTTIGHRWHHLDQDEMARVRRMLRQHFRVMKKRQEQAFLAALQNEDL